jgi:hypothetical protein
MSISSKLASWIVVVGGLVMGTGVYACLLLIMNVSEARGLLRAGFQRIKRIA